MVLQYKSTDEEDEGRGGDTVLGHLTIGEVVIPVQMAEDKDFQEVLSEYFKVNGATLEQYTVGHKDNSINPETDYPEFGFFSGVFRAFKSIFKKPKIPKPPKPAKPKEPAKKASAAVRRARQDSKEKSRSKSGDASTKNTGPRGLMTEANTANKTLLGGN